MKAIERRQLMVKVEEAAAAGAGLAAACASAGISESTYQRWAQRYAEGGMDALEDLPRPGRPRLIVPTPEEAACLRRAALRVNRGDGTGSMSLTARLCALDETNCLRPETRAAILKPRASKHLQPVGIREAVRASEAVVRRYRDPKSGLNDGLFTPGWLRMSSDGVRLLVPGERQVWDDASVNVGVVVPWERGFDGVNERTRFRVSRFQLLMGVDCQRDFIVGYSYVMRNNDAYGGADVAAALHRVWTMAGYAPDECVMEGGAWQSERARQYLDAAGVRLISAKGRPQQKLVEGVFNRLWTTLSYFLPPNGQIGRFRGEMKSETREWIACREGRADPRDHFPLLTDFLRALDKAIETLNNDMAESKEYGNAVRSELYKAVAVKGHPLPQGLLRYALPVRVRRTLIRFGQVSVKTECPFGWDHHYYFQSENGAAYNGAPVYVAFDPARIADGAVIELAGNFRDAKAGTVIDTAAPCVSPAPDLVRTQSGFWQVECLDPRAAARAAKKGSRAKVGAQVAAFDERGIKARHAEHESAPGESAERYGFSGAAPQIPEPAPQAEPDWAKLEAEAGIIAG